MSYKNLPLGDGRKAITEPLQTTPAAAALHQAKRALSATVANNPAHLVAWVQLAGVHEKLGETAEALRCIETACALDTRSPPLLEVAARLASVLGKHADVLAWLAKLEAVSSNPLPVQLEMLAVAIRLKRFGEAEAIAHRGLARDPSHMRLLAGMLRARKFSCRWAEDDAAVEKRFLSLIGQKPQEARAADLFLALALGLPPERQHALTRAYTAAHYDSLPRYTAFSPPVEGKIRLGYISTDFGDHATGHLVAGMFAFHDRARFSVTAYAAGTPDGSIFCRKIESGVDAFVDLSTLSDEECARRIHADGVDILLDINGYNMTARPGIMARRPAPVQVNYLAYPATMAASFMDYYVGDPLSLPETVAAHFSEKILYMPHTYFVCDPEPPVAVEKPTRAECGLPEQGAVFCCFNSPYKITPQVFGVWMRILQAVPGSVLWLLHGGAEAESSLRGEAARRGVAAERLVFAPRARKPEHMARHGLADIFLDCFSVNAHTTAVDALAAGAPVLTCAGDSLINRACAGIVTAAGVPELVAEDRQAYERLAIHYGNNEAAMAALKGRLAAARATAPLFDAARYVRDLETGLETAWRLYREGRPPQHIHIEGAPKK